MTENTRRVTSPTRATSPPPPPPQSPPTASGISRYGSNFKLLVNKPQAIVIDLLGVLVAKSFMTSSREFKEFFQTNLNDYLNDYWRQKQLRVTINFFRCSQKDVPEDFKLADRDEAKEDQIRQARRHVMWKWKNDPNNSALSLFMLGITDWGYKNKILQTGVYEEVPNILKMWRETARVPVYVGVGSADFLVMVLSSTNQGNILPMFNGHMNIMDFDGTKANKDFKKLVAILRLTPEKVLYLTRYRRDCKKAIESGLQSIIVLRPDFDIGSVIPALRQKRANINVIDGTLRNRPITPEDHPPQNKAGKQIADVKNPEMKKELVDNISSLSMIDDAEDLNTPSSVILDTDLNKYNVVLSLSEITFK